MLIVRVFALVAVLLLAGCGAATASMPPPAVTTTPIGGGLDVTFTAPATDLKVKEVVAFSGLITNTTDQELSVYYELDSGGVFQSATADVGAGRRLDVVFRLRMPPVATTTAITLTVAALEASPPLTVTRSLRLTVQE